MITTKTISSAVRNRITTLSLRAAVNSGVMVPCASASPTARVRGWGAGSCQSRMTVCWLQKHNTLFNEVAPCAVLGAGWRLRRHATGDVGLSHILAGLLRKDPRQA